MNDGNAKQQIVEKIKSSTNILVTVSSSPSVDELSAALGLSVMINKMGKHATAVFSGAIPPAITFLDPQKTFENTVDSLRDFIIALDKEKADHLRYKVEGEVVKIFITPYRTTITSDDLDFSQGDYNVELVLALGVSDKDNLDEALTAHGRILHDATVATISIGSMKSELGSLDWHEENASSLSEMLVSLNDSLKSDKPLLDEQIATAFLTGIVAATDRFSNNRTSSRVMTMAAQLMAAGANQQLIAAKLQEGHEIGPETPVVDAAHSDGTTDLSEGESTKLEKSEAVKSKNKEAKPKKNDGSLTIDHEAAAAVVAEVVAADVAVPAPTDDQDELDRRTQEVTAQQQADAAKLAEQHLAEQLSAVAPVAPTASPSVADLQNDLAEASAEVEQAAEEPVIVPPAPLSGAVSTDMWKKVDEPSMGGTLNATTEEAADEQRRQEEDDRNRTILSHNSGYVGDSQPTFQAPINSASAPNDEPAVADVFSAPAPSFATDPTPPTAYAPTIQPPAPTLADLDEQNRPHEEARAAINAAFEAAPVMPTDEFTPTLTPQDFGEPAPAQFTPPEPVLPPLPDFSTLPPLPSFDDAQSATLPPENFEDVLGPAPAPNPSTPPAPSDPGQFRIPGQQ